MSHLTFTLIALLIVMGLTLGCGAPNSPTKSTIVTSTTVIIDLTCNIGGDPVEVISIVLADRNPQQYDP